MLFSGTVFARQGDAFAVDQVPWSSEVMYKSRHALPTWDSTLHDLLLAKDDLPVHPEREPLP
jgi:hypothetical protein